MREKKEEKLNKHMKYNAFILGGGIFFLDDHVCLCTREFACQMKSIQNLCMYHIHKSRLLITIQFQKYCCLFASIFFTQKL